MTHESIRRKLVTYSLTGSLLVLWVAGIAEAKRCSPDSVAVGPICVDKYEVSVWSTTDPKLVKSIGKGKINEASDLTAAIQHGVAGDDYGAGCPDTAAGCTSYYAVSIPGVVPSTYVNWFQAVAACRNSGKRLLTNVEWQAAALGTADPYPQPDATYCNVASEFALVPVLTGSRSSCVSDTGAFDMVGNVAEWVADWDEPPSGCGFWGATFGNDVSCIGSYVNIGHPPGALIRGMAWELFDAAGVFAVTVENLFTTSESPNLGRFGFRCAR